MVSAAAGCVRNWRRIAARAATLVESLLAEMSGQRYRLLSFGRQLGIGVADSRHATVNAVAKTNGPNAPYCVPNELICAALGTFLCLPVPPAAILDSTSAKLSTPWFASLDFNLTGSSLPPVDVRLCVAQMPSPSTGLVVFDYLVANCDRHAKNFAVDFLASPPRMSVFDHSHALFGYQAGKGSERLRELRDRLGMSGGTRTGPNRHCLLDVLDTSDHFELWVRRVESLPDFQIEEAVGQAVGLGMTPSEASEAVSFLKYRRDNIRPILRAHRSEFTAIKIWGLFS